jgi:epoxyqueuosine reductase
LRVVDMSGSIKSLIQNLAQQLGFHRTVIGSLAPLESERAHLEQWLASGYAAGMEWLKRNPHFRTSPQLLLPQCRSAIIVSVNYYTQTPPAPDFAAGRVARYAVGLDYHPVLRAKLRELKTRIESELGRPLQGKAYTDDVPLYEQAFASRHGLGFTGKNTMIIGPKLSGSYNFVAELFTDLELEADEAYSGTCGECFRCGDRCPTKAILRTPATIDAGRCISYLTIENKGGIPLELRQSLGEWVFGCDVCQEVCPYNGKPRQTPWPEFSPESGAGHFLDLLSILKIRNEEEFRSKFAHTPLRRPKLRGLTRNTLIVLGNQLGGRGVRQVDEELLIPEIEKATIDCADPMLREHAAWAVAQSSAKLAKWALERMKQRECEVVLKGQIADLLDTKTHS